MEFTIELRLWSNLFDFWFHKPEIGEKYADRLIPVDEFQREIKVSDLNDELLEAILENHLDGESALAELVPLNGGITIRYGEKQVGGQNCCGDYSNIHNWFNILRDKSPEWKSIWIGHPWLLYRVRDNVIYFTDHCELNPEWMETADKEKIQVFLGLPFTDFDQKLRVCKQEAVVVEKAIHKCLLKYQNRFDLEKLGNVLIKGEH